MRSATSNCSVRVSDFHVVYMVDLVIVQHSFSGNDDNMHTERQALE